MSAARMWSTDWLGGGGGGVLSMGTICPQSQDKIHHIYNLLKVRDLGQPPVGIYYSLFNFFWPFTKIRMLTVVFNRNS